MAPRSSPAMMSLMASLYLTPNSQATSDPLHPPLPGMGSITKVTRNMAPTVLNLWECLALVRANIFWRILSQIGQCLAASLAMIGQSHRTTATEIMFPSVPARAACQMVRSQSVYPRGMANRCSTSGRQATPAVAKKFSIIGGDGTLLSVFGKLKWMNGV